MFSLSQLSRKFSRILSIWQSGQGVVSLHVFHNTTAEEAFCREACMIDAIGETSAMDCILYISLMVVGFYSEHVHHYESRYCVY